MLQTTNDERGTFDAEEFSDELERAESNHDIGTALWFEDDRIRVFESKLEPGQRAPFHVHDRTYFWTVVDPGRGLQRFADGSYVVHDYVLGETKRLEHTASETLIHDLENVGDTTLRFVTVELKD
ncbi:MAG: hypothetical protein ACRDJB_07580 [Actinomycetota bacterium]